MTRQSARTLLALALLAGLGVFAACGSASTSSTGPSAQAGKGPLVVATTPILGDLVRQVGGDQVEVNVLIPLGTDPHDFEPSAAQAARLRNATLVVANGLGLEERLETALDGARKDGVTVFEVGAELDPLPFGESFGGGDGHGSEDPHAWLDPERMAKAASLVAEQLAVATGQDSAGFQRRAATYATAARAAEAEARALLDQLPTDQRKLITNHDALEYFAQRFNLQVIGTVIPGGSTLAEPSAADLSDLVALIKTNNVRAIFSESTVSAKLIGSLAREVGSQVQVVELSTDTLGETGTATATYPGLIVSTARLIARGLSGR